jgi:hypothetical protein
MSTAFPNRDKTHALLRNPILVIDRDGLIGEPLSLKLAREFIVVFVSRKSLNLKEKNKNIIQIPFVRKFPTIPDEKYSHIIFIEREMRDLELLPKIIKKVKDINADFIFAQELSSKGEYVIDKILKLYSSAKVVLLGDIFDDKLIIKQGNFKSIVNKFLYQAQNFGKMQVLGDGLGQAYPVSLVDVVDGLINLVFGAHRKHSLFYLFPKYPPSELSLAHMIQKNNPEIMIDFVRHDPRHESIVYPLNGENLLEDKYQIAKKIRGIDIKKRVTVREEKQHEGLRKYKNFPVVIFWVLIFLLSFPYFFSVLFFSLGFSTLYYAKGEMDKGNISNVRSSLHLSQGIFSAGKQASRILFLQAKAVGLEGNLKNFSQDLESGYKMSEGLLQAFDAGTYFSAVLSGNSKDSAVDFAKGKNLLKSSVIGLEKVKAEGMAPAPILQSLESVNPLVKLLSSVVDGLPSILGMEGLKTYLILFQDNTELRPSGGVVNSYGILKLDKGKIINFSIHDVDDADSQLRGHIEPPFAIRRYLPSEHWYLKDSSFDVDFVKSASLASHFLLVETGEKADGIVSVDVFCLKNILHAVGPIYLADYKENVSENNLYALVQSHDEKDYLSSIYKETIKQLTKTKKSYLLIAQAISDSLVQKHLMLASKDWQNVLTVNGWSSSLWDERKNDDKSIKDFVGISEANLGMNKASNFVKRLVFQKVVIGEDGSIEEELNINYKNEGTVWPGGDYKNYLRIILSKDTKLTEVSINDVQQKIVDAIIDPFVYEGKKFKAPKGLEIEKIQEENKTIFGFIVTIPSKKTVKIKLRYTLNENISLNVFSYNLKLFKQPGTDSVPYSFLLTYPKFLNIVRNSEGVSGGDGKASLSKEIIKDENLIIDFAKK